MRTFILIAFIINGWIIKAQITGVTVYTVSTGNFGVLLTKQKFSQNPAGDIYYYSNANKLVKFSAGTFSVYPVTVPVIQIFKMNTFAYNAGVWYYSEDGDAFYFNGTTFTDYSANISGLIGAVSTSNCINYMGTQGSNVLFATKKGIVKFDGSNFSLINKANSNLVCDTVNCIYNTGSTTYIGTDKGLCTYNGSNFSSLIPFIGAPSHKVNFIFSNGVKTIVTRNDNSSKFNYYQLNGNQLNRMPAFADSADYNSAFCQYMCFLNNDPMFVGSGGFIRRVAANTTYTTYAAVNNSYSVFKHLGNSQKFYTAALGPEAVSEIDIINYTNYNFNNGNNDGFKNLDTNNVNALIGKTSLKHAGFFGMGQGGYEVPKGSGYQASGTTNLWIGGLDNSNQLHLAGETYRQSGQDFWPGPLDTVTGVANSITGSPFNKVWKLSCNQINQFAANYNAANFSANTSASFSEINSFIANGSSTNNFAKQLAPYKDWNNNGKYEPSLGEYPVIKGHQQIYSVFNDNYKPHYETGGLPLGVEVHEKSYSFNTPSLPDSMQVINYSTFYNYQVYNRSNTNYNNTYITLWSDCDLGNYLNDYIGTDTLNDFGYVYNANNIEGSKSPMLAFALMPNATAQCDGIDNNNNGQIDEINERFKLNLTTFYNNNIGTFPPATTNPYTKWHFYNYMSGKWKDSTDFKPIGSAYNPTLAIAPTKHVFTGNPQTNTGWTEASAGNAPGDRRLLCTIGPFNFPAKKKVEFEYGIVFSRDTTLNNVPNNFSLLQRDVKNVKYFINQQNTSACTPIVYVGLKEKSMNKLNLWMYPNPVQSQLIINLNYNAVNAKVSLYDVSGRLVAETTINDSYTTTMDMAELTEGVYFVQVEDGSHKLNGKIIKIN